MTKLTYSSLHSVDPTSIRADELRRLLDIVAGQAPDELGRVSEPIVKDEMAIVDFLTQKANAGSSNGQPIRSSAPIPPYSHILPGHRPTRRMDSSNDAESSSRARAASDTLRRPHMAGTSSDPSIQPRPPYLSDPAWSFVAPGMSQISVQSPFGPSESTRKTLVPGPLRPPVPRQGFFQRPTASSETNRSRGSQSSQSQSQQQQQQSLIPISSEGQYSALGSGPSSNTTPPNQMQYNRASSDAAYAPSAVSDSSYRADISPSQPVPNMNLPLLEEPAPFSDAWLDANFNFGIGDLGAVATSGPTGFNPFALAQQDTQDVESE